MFELLGSSLLLLYILVDYTVADAGSGVFRYIHLINNVLCLSCRDHVESLLQLEY